MRRIHLIAIVVLINLSFVFGATAQASYAGYKVDDLTDAQIIQMMKQAESIGYTDAQLEQMAAAKGMSPAEVQKLRARVNQLNGTDASAAQAGDRNVVAATAPSTTATDVVNPKIFGAELFQNGNISFEPNLRIATPKNYIIGPDDKLLIDITGDNEAKYELPVSVEGVINLQYVGLISVGGLTIEQATSKIKTAMARTYPSLSTGRTTVAINIGNIRSIKVTLTGNLVKSGTYTLSSLSTVYNALYASGGPSQNGSFRNIQVIRNNKIVATIDVYNFLLKGVAQNNIRLQDQDVIHVPVFEKRVEMGGQVKRPALFEVIKGETLQDVIDFSGGFTTTAYTAIIKSTQNTDKERRIVDVDAAQFPSYLPQNGDTYFVDAILDRFENRVHIAGAVFRGGDFELTKGLTLKGLIVKADGLTDDAFLNRGYISRLNADLTQSIIPFDVAKLFTGTGNDIVLQREDRVSISSIFDLRDEYKVTIQGEVRSPATFAYADNMSLATAIQLAGGFRVGATPNRVEIARRVKNTDTISASARTAQVFIVNIEPDLTLAGAPFILEPFDIITVRNAEGYEVQRQVLIEGEVLFPGLYTLTTKDEKIASIIARAGGLSPLAYAAGASLKRPLAVNSGTKNAINDAEEKQKTTDNLKRLQEGGTKDSAPITITYEQVSSDLVGINLTAILKDSTAKSNLILLAGDVIRIPRLLQTVKISGEVLNPNNMVYSKGRSLNYYINGAGGFTSNAKKGRLFVKYANGTAAGVSKFLFFKTYPSIQPGAEILVPKKAEREKISPQAWIGIGTALASLGAIVVALLK